MVSKVTFASARPKELRSEATLAGPAGPHAGDVGFQEAVQAARRWPSRCTWAATWASRPFTRCWWAAWSRRSRTPAASRSSPTSPGAVATAKRSRLHRRGAGLPAAAGRRARPTSTSTRRKVDFRSLKTVELAGDVVDADAMIVLSHGKGHGHSGFGGAIKNIAMGCVDGPTRGKIHRLMTPVRVGRRQVHRLLAVPRQLPQRGDHLQGRARSPSSTTTASTACTAHWPARSKAITIDQCGVQVLPARHGPDGSRDAGGPEARKCVLRHRAAGGAKTSNLTSTGLFGSWRASSSLNHLAG